ncbi:histone deacetylase family protein [Nannocystis radixulma]|uniref:Histone deacetylase n=1 Tax=Nannocystis radixulma TaxID=2995305 RepID=A0ABT5BH73_9BACT|nr:histone deacetylase [Nannocystis radixulma]MDC0673494.1 histone deacetylase [Nannocystis radixulma]
MHVFYSDQFVLPLPPGHRFPMAKYAALRARVDASGLVDPADMHVPERASEEQLALAHDLGYVGRVCRGELSAREQREIGFPWSEQMVERSLRSTGATIGACRAALIHRSFAVNLAGGTHHAFRDRGDGYCVFNDTAVAARVMQAERRAARVLVVDCDVHQGDGTAAILAGDDTIFTFSIHGAKNYPFKKEVSDLDIHLPDRTGDAEYLTALEAGLAEALRRADPDLAIYLAGADPYEGDRLGRLALTKAGLARRDRMVLQTLLHAHVPTAISMAGGYAKELDDVVDIHFTTVSIAAEICSDWP